MTMKCLGPVFLVDVLIILSVASAMPRDSTTVRSSPPIGETIKQLTNQLMELNKTADIVLDTRTPPRVKQQQKLKEAVENSHAGIAVPIDDEALLLEETTKKVNFYKLEKPTTNSGLSTWILLSGQTPSPPSKMTTKVVETDAKPQVTDVPNRIIKPMFKKRVPSTRRPSSTTASSTTTSHTVAPNTTKMNKVKVSVLNNALQKKQNSTSHAPQKSTTTVLTTEALTTPVAFPQTTEIPARNTSLNESLDNIGSNALPLEAKEGDVELTTTAVADTKKTRRPTTKRKKNKHRKRRPSVDKSGNSTSTKITHKVKPIGTQIYNYLSREVMPTVGVGLVGLMVTAGLASYFLYPFGAARRNFDIDRKDTKAPYYYDAYDSGGIAEEEAIGKVIAGMQTTANYNSYRQYNGKNAYVNVHQRQPSVQASIETVPVNPTNNIYDGSPNYQTESYQNNNYDKDVIEQSKETSYAVDDKQFVVGNVPKDIYPDVTPVTVPEHGPRSLKLRKRRDVDLQENEIFPDVSHDSLSALDSTVTNIDLNTTSTEKTPFEMAPDNTFTMWLKGLFDMIVIMGIQMLSHSTETVARFLASAYVRLDEHYRQSNQTNLYH